MGGLVGPLQVSLSRAQYRQVLETAEYLLTTLSPTSEVEKPVIDSKLGDIEEEEETTADGNSHLDISARRKYSSGSIASHSLLSFNITFDISEFTVKLLAELGVQKASALVAISFRDFILNFDRPKTTSSHLQVRYLLTPNCCSLL